MTNVFGITAREFRWYNDDGSESGSTARETANADCTVSPDNDTDIVLRYGVQESGSGSAAGTAQDDYQLQYSLNGGAFTNVTGSSTVVQAHPSANLTDAAATTQRLSSGTGAFVAGEIDEADGIVTDWQLTANNFSELLFSIRALAADLSEGDDVTFRVLRNGAVFNTYSVTPGFSAIGATNGTATPSTVARTASVPSATGIGEGIASPSTVARTSAVPLVSAVGFAKLFDTFSRSVTDGWGTSDAGSAWTIVASAADFDVNGAEGTISVPVSSTRFARIGPSTITEGEMIHKFKYDTTPASGNLEIQQRFLVIAGTDHYRTFARVTGGGVFQLLASVVVANSGTTLGSILTTDITPATGTWFWMKSRWGPDGSGGVNIECKLWQDGTTEPAYTDANKAIQRNDATQQHAAGDMGLAIFNGAGNSTTIITIDNLSIEFNLLLENSFEGGTDETTISTANSGGASGLAWSTVSIASGGVAVYDSAQVKEGSLAARLAQTAGSAVYLEWQNPLNPDLWTAFMRFYIYLPDTLPANMNIADFFTDTGGGVAHIRLNTNLSLAIINEAGTTVDTSTIDYNLDEWMRLELRARVGDPNGEIELRTFIGADLENDVNDPTETLIATGTDMGTVAIGRARFGFNAHGAVTYQYWLDDIGVASDDWLGSTSTATNGVATPDTVARTASVPSVTGVGEGIAQPSAVARTSSVPSATGIGNGIASPATVSRTASAPQATGVGNGIALPSTVARTSSVPSATGVGNGIAQPSTVGATASVPQATGNVGGVDGTAQPSTVARTASVPSASGVGTGVAQPVSVARTASVPTTSAAGAGVASPSTVSRTASVPAASGIGNAIAQPSAVARTAAVPAPTGQGSGSATPDSVSRSAAVPSASGIGNGVAQPSTVARTASVPQASGVVEGNGIAQPNVVARSASVPSATGAGSGVASPAVVQASATVQPPLIIVAGIASPAVVIATASVPQAVGRGAAVSAPSVVIAVAAVPQAIAIAGVAPTVEGPILVIILPATPKGEMQQVTPTARVFSSTMKGELIDAT